MTTTSPGCAFCRAIAERETYGGTYHAVRLAPLSPVVPGHILVISREHIPHAAANPYVTGEVMAVAASAAGEMGDCNIITSIGAAASQTVAHLHVHVVPRHIGDGLKLPWTKETS